MGVPLPYFATTRGRGRPWGQGCRSVALRVRPGRAYAFAKHRNGRRQTMAETIDTGTNDLLASLDGGVLTLTLNRPEARNAMSDDMNQALARQLASAELDSAVKCVVLTGA